MSDVGSAASKMMTCGPVIIAGGAPRELKKNGHQRGLLGKVGGLGVARRALRVVVAFAVGAVHCGLRLLELGHLLLQLCHLGLRGGEARLELARSLIEEVRERMSLRRPTTRAIASPVDFELEHKSERRCVMTFCTSSWPCKGCGLNYAQI